MSPFNKKNNLIQTYSLIIIDVICVLLSYALAYVIRYRGKQYMGQVDFVICLLLILFCILYSFLLDWNHFIFKRGYFEEFMAILKYTVSLTILLGFTVFIIRQGAAFSRLVFGIFAVFDAIFTYIAHNAFKKYLYYFYKKSVSSDKVMIVTTKEYINDVLNDIKEAAEWSYDVIAIALLDEKVDEEELCGIPVVAYGENFLEEAKQIMMDIAYIYLPENNHHTVDGIIEGFETMGVACYYSVGNLGNGKSMQSVGTFAGHLIITYEANTIDYRRRFIKRFCDVIGALVGVIITAILYPFIAIAIKINSKGPVIFKQTRIGRNGRRFPMYKFRSMYLDAEERQKDLLEKNEMKGLMFKMENDPRITKVGKFLRKTSLDEFPQFLNVIKNDMSLVGTRPPTLDEVKKYQRRFWKRLSIKPGITGNWQVNGRSSITDFEKVLEYDLDYIDDWNLLLDMKIMVKTIRVLLKTKGAF